MDDHLRDVLKRIGEEFRNCIQQNSVNYRLVNIGEKSQSMGHTDLKGRYGDVYAIVPLKEPQAGMKVLIDGRTFVDYAQFKSGIVVPGYVARAAGMPHDPYRASESMILNFA